MHRSRIGVVLIDAPEESHADTLGFWAEAAGREPETSGDSPYSSLGAHGGLRVEIQRIGSGTPARVHLDIETDDVAAEVARLEGLGAIVYEQREKYTVMTDPAGLLFCVVPVWTGQLFEDNATGWPD